MTDVKDVLERVEQLKENLILLNKVYDDIFKPWILVVSHKNKIETTDSKSSDIQTKDLNLLYKLQNVLINASSAKEIVPKSIKKIEIVKEDIKLKKSVTFRSVSADRRKIVEQKPEPKASKRPVTTAKAKYIPAHRTAPFQTNPNLHKPKPKFDANSRPIAPRPAKGNIESISIRNSIPGTSMAEDVPKSICDPKPVDEESVVVTSEAIESVGHMLCQLQEHIKRLHETPEEDAPALEEPIRQMKTIVEAGDAMKIPLELKRECMAYSKLISCLSCVYLQKKKITETTQVEKARKAFLESSLNLASKRLAREIHRARSVENVLSKISNIANFIDIESCNSTQIGFLQACLSWALSQYIDLQSSNTHNRYTPMSTRPQSGAEKIRGWLDGREGHKRCKDESNRALEVVCLTNCPFITAVKSRKNQPISLSVRHPSISPFKFGMEVGSPIVSCSPRRDLATRMLIIQQELYLSWVPLITQWIHTFKQKRDHGDSLSASYRQIYGLLLGKYPVILEDLP